MGDRPIGIPIEDIPIEYTQEEIDEIGESDEDLIRQEHPSRDPFFECQSECVISWCWPKPKPLCDDECKEGLCLKARLNIALRADLKG